MRLLKWWALRELSYAVGLLVYVYVQAQALLTLSCPPASCTLASVVRQATEHADEAYPPPLVGLPPLRAQSVAPPKPLPPVCRHSPRLLCWDCGGPMSVQVSARSQRLRMLAADFALAGDAAARSSIARQIRHVRALRAVCRYCGWVER